MEEKVFITCFSDIFKIGITYGSNWYRGHAKEVGELIPKVFRPYESAKEKMYISQFRRLGPSYVNNFPKSYSEILFYMQHYGIPTRLLDWTENILIALFFAVIDNKSENGELWVLNPSYLIEKVSQKVNIENLSKFLISEPFTNDRNKLLKELGLKDEDLFPMTYYPGWIDKRIAAQQSVFTIHTDHLNKNNTIIDLIKDPCYIQKFVIPSKLKNNFESFLYNLGITYRHIMPDIEGLSKEIVENTARKGNNRLEGYPIKDVLKLEEEKYKDSENEC